MGKEDKPKMKNLFIEMPVDIHQKLKDLAYVRGMSMKDLVIDFVRNAPEPEIKRTPNAEYPAPASGASVVNETGETG